MSPEQRSYNMSRVRGQDTKPEKAVRSFLHRAGLRFRKNQKSLPGKPDIVLPKYRAVVFVHGCFWHGHENCKKAKLPETRKEFWEQKIGGNKLRDQSNLDMLRKEGWRTFIVWTCELKNLKDTERTVEKLIYAIKET